MIRGIAKALFSNSSQTSNGHDPMVTLVEPPRASDDSKWTNLGKHKNGDEART